MVKRTSYLHLAADDTIKRKATAEFTLDMVETLNVFFQAYADGGVVKIEVTNHGLWLVNPHTGGRQFLGLAHLEGDRRNVN